MNGPDLRALLARDGRVSLSLRVQPKSPRTEWAGLLADGTYKVRLAAVPEKGKANDELIRFLAAEAGLARAQVEIVAGAGSQRKQVRIRNRVKSPTSL
jgi:uncharacterized protein (TIGR00251 family)